ncbi:MAG: hypothetical protein M1840_007858 [Geoglossum simile]|nr:MAG: hypothetical protein M1840_007858 [Geoglossum simile]
MKSLGNLPMDIVVELMNFLPAQDIVNVRLVCRNINKGVSAGLSQAFMESRVGHRTHEENRWRDMARLAYYEQAHSNFSRGAASRVRLYYGDPEFGAAGRFSACRYRRGDYPCVDWEAIRRKKGESPGGTIRVPEWTLKPGHYRIRMNEEGYLYLKEWNLRGDNPGISMALHESMWHLPTSKLLWDYRSGYITRTAAITLGKEFIYTFRNRNNEHDSGVIDVLSISSGITIRTIPFPPFFMGGAGDRFKLVRVAEREFIICLPGRGNHPESVSFGIIDPLSGEVLYGHVQPDFEWVDAISQPGGFVLYSSSDRRIGEDGYTIYQGFVSLKDDYSFHKLEISAITTDYFEFQIDPDTQCGLGMDNRLTLLSFSLAKVPEDKRIRLKLDVPQYCPKDPKVVREGEKRLPQTKIYSLHRIGPCIFRYQSTGYKEVLVDFRLQDCLVDPPGADDLMSKCVLKPEGFPASVSYCRCNGARQMMVGNSPHPQEAHAGEGRMVCGNCGHPVQNLVGGGPESAAQ